jgi:hypothetical protein
MAGTARRDQSCLGRRWKLISARAGHKRVTEPEDNFPRGQKIAFCQHCIAGRSAGRAATRACKLPSNNKLPNPCKLTAYPARQLHQLLGRCHGELGKTASKRRETLMAEGAVDWHRQWRC